MKEARILVVDDEARNATLITRVLHQAGYRDVDSVTDPREAVALFAKLKPDIVLLDLQMPYLDGFEVMRRIRMLTPPGEYLPILVLTADVTDEPKRRALAEGAKDFLTKPFDVNEVVLRMRNLLETRRLHRLLQDQNRTLEERVQERTHELEEAYSDTFERLALAAEYRDDDTGQHTRRVGLMSSLVAHQLGLPGDVVTLIERAAGLHDIGKIGIPDAILLAPRKLTSEEFEVVKTHTSIGRQILSGSRSPLLQMAEQIAWSHHERWDGTGYARLEREDIPLVGRIASVVDVFDALTHDRPYKTAWPVDEAVAEIRRQAGCQFDPRVVEAFLQVQDRGMSQVGRRHEDETLGVA
jgi:putative two-component system response regulator